MLSRGGARRVVSKLSQCFI